MALFVDWMVYRDLATLLALLEHAEYFNPQNYDTAFEGELEKLFARIHSPEIQQQVAELRGFDWAGYICRSLQRAGFKDDDQQEHFQSIVIKLLVSPGKLFRGWVPGKHGPLERRFRRSVWNAIKNLAEKTRNTRKWMVASDPVAMAERVPAKALYSSLIDAFRSLVGQRLGSLAMAILDWRLSGKDTKDLVGKSEIGSPSIHAVKREVKEVKKLAKDFAVRHGDASFLNMLNRAMGREAETTLRRKRTAAARQVAKSV